MSQPSPHRNPERNRPKTSCYNALKYHNIMSAIAKKYYKFRILTPLPTHLRLYDNIVWRLDSAQLYDFISQNLLVQPSQVHLLPHYLSLRMLMCLWQRDWITITNRWLKIKLKIQNKSQRKSPFLIQIQNIIHSSYRVNCISYLTCPVLINPWNWTN